MTIETNTAETSLDIEVRCSECNAVLEAEFSEHTRDYRTTRTLSVTPCEKCLQDRYEEGMDDGPVAGEDSGPAENVQGDGDVK